MTDVRIDSSIVVEDSSPSRSLKCADLLAVNLDTDEFQRALELRLGEIYEVHHWPYYQNKAGRAWKFNSLRPLTALHLDAVREMRRGPDLDCDRWPGDLSAEQVRSVQLLCDRVFPTPLNQGELVSYLSRLSAGIDGQLDGVSFRCALFPATPHVPWDLLAAFKLVNRGIPVLAIRATQLTNRVVVARLPFDYVFGEFETRVVGPSLTESNDVGSVLESFRADSPRLVIAKEINKRATPSSGRFLSVQSLNMIRSVAEVVGRRGRVVLKFFAQKLGPPWRFGMRNWRAERNREEHYWNFISSYRFVWLRCLSIVHGYRLLRELARFSGRPAGRFVYFSLHYQPEQNTDPEASDFRFQVSAVSELRRRLDDEGLEDLGIVVKEHPRQFSGGGDVRLRNFRPLGFYESLASIPGTTVVDPSIDSGVLISDAELVVSANGSATWEAARQGKPALTLVSTWHSLCSAAPSIASLTATGRGIRDLINLSPDEVFSSVISFLETETITIPGAFKGPHADLSRNPRLVEEMAQCLASIIDQVST